MRIRNRLQSDDQGAVLLTVGIFLLALMVFAAWAVDISSVLVERRSAQNTADVSALSGAQMTLRLTPNAAVAAAEAEVRRLSLTNFGTTDADWNACADASKPARFTVSAPSTACVSFTTGLTEMRVRVPDRDVATSFAGVIGINTIATSAFAEVTTGNGQSGGVLPFGLPPSSAGAEVCLKTSPGPLPAPPCDGPDEGNFGFLDFKLYTVPGASSCNAGDLIANIASGVDHFLETGGANASSVHEFDFCPNINARPDRTKAETGNVASKFHEGFVDSSSPMARLQRGPWTKTNTMGQSLDDKPLWEFISFGNGLCVEATIAATVPPHDGMAACLGSGDAGSLRFFEDSGGLSGVYDLIESPRWAFVPNIDIDFVAGGSQDYIFTAFTPVFLQTLYGDCNALTCKEFNPGEASNIGANKKAVAVTAFLIPMSSLPAEVIATFPGTEISIDYLLTR